MNAPLPPTPVDPTAVADFLNSTQASPAPPEVKSGELPVDFLDHLTATGGRLNSGQPAPAEPAPRIETPLNPIYTDQLPTTDKAATWLREFGGMGTVNVTPHERNLYLKAALNDTPVIYDMTLLDGAARVRVRSCTPRDLEIIFAAARKDEAEGQILRNVPSLGARVYLYSVLVQVDQFNHEIYERFNFAPDADITAGAEQLRERLKAVLPVRSWPKWNLLSSAVKLFEHKMKICTDNLVNEDFWKTAGADS